MPVTCQRNNLTLINWEKQKEITSIEEEVNGRWIASESQLLSSERFPLSIFSQGQIISLASDGQEALLNLIDKELNITDSKEKLKKSKQDFLTLSSNAKNLKVKLENYEQVKFQLDDIKRKLINFENLNNANILKSFQIVSNQKQEIDQKFENIENFSIEIQDLINNKGQSLITTNLRSDTTENQITAILEPLNKEVQKTFDIFIEASKNLQTIVTNNRKILLESNWFKAFNETTEEYDLLIKKLAQDGVTNPKEYEDLVKTRQRLEVEISILEQFKSNLNELNIKIMEKKEEVSKIRLDISKLRQESLKRILKDNLYVKINIITFGREPLLIEQSLRELLETKEETFQDDILLMNNNQTVKGIIHDLLIDLPDDNNDTITVEEKIELLKNRIKNACTGNGDFGARFNNYLKTEYEKKPELVDRLTNWYPEDTLDISYSPKGDGTNFTPIKQGSAGQRAAAMLAFLLNFGNDPIILDQPEDDLDNQLIYELVVNQIRAKKFNRQIIVVTHNPNILVNGDAEMIHVFDFIGGQCQIVQSGGLQDSKIRHEICNVLEGGKEAFERRYQRIIKYSPNFSKSL